MNFKKHDTVRLKSGGPVMTISQLTLFSQVSCTWMNNEGNVQRTIFHANELVPATVPDNKFQYLKCSCCGSTWSQLLCCASCDGNPKPELA